MVAPIVQTGADIVLTGLKLFSDERRRHLSKTYLELKTNLDNAKSAVHPDYTDKAVTQAKKELKNFQDAYASEFEQVVDAIVGARNA